MKDTTVAARWIFAIPLICGFIAISAHSVGYAQSQGNIQIVSPADGMVVSPGQTVDVAVSTLQTCQAMVVVAVDPIPSAGPLKSAPWTFSMAIPANISAGKYQLTVVCAISSNQRALSKVSIIIENSSPVTELSSEPENIFLDYVGAQRFLIVVGTFPDGTSRSVSGSTAIRYTSNNSTVAVVSSGGEVTATGAGTATIQAVYGGLTVDIPVSVPATIRGDLNGDGKVDQDDLNIILSDVDTPATEPNDARDLNHDGVINDADAGLLGQLCTNANCATCPDPSCVISVPNPNQPPTLAFTGEGGYTTDGVEPGSGDTSTTFGFRVKYSDADNDSPLSGYPKVHILLGGTPISGSPFTMSYVSGTNSGGAIYSYSRTFAAGTTYAYRFEAYDSKNAQASGAPTTDQSGPTVTVPAVIFVEQGGFCNENKPCFTSIQLAINAVAGGGTIKVAQGLVPYHENIIIDSSRSFTIGGGWNTTFTARASDPVLTVIDGDLPGGGVGEGSVIAIEASTGESIEVTIDGFTIQTGNDETGGGVFASATAGGQVHLTLNRNIIRTNKSTDSGAGVGLYAEGAASNVQAILTNNMILGNNAGGDGGGIFASSENSANLTLTLVNNTVTDNTASGVGGGLRAESANSGSATDVTATNNIIWGNSAASGHDIAVRQSEGGTATVHSSFNDVGDVVADAGAPGTYDDLGDNIDANPLFANLILGDLHLGLGSPAKNAGTDIGAPLEDFEGEARPQGVYYDIGADERTVSLTPPDLAIDTVTLRSGEIGVGYGYGLEILGGQAP